MFDQNKFNDIVTKHRDGLLKYCTNKVPNDYFAAEEITNDVFVIMYQKWNTIHFTGTKTWLIKTANYRILNYFRNKNYEDSLSDFTDQNLPDELRYDTLEDSIVSEQFIQAILSSLDDTERMLFTYRYTDGMTISEISELTEIPYSTVRLKLIDIENTIRNLIKNETNQNNSQNVYN